MLLYPLLPLLVILVIEFTLKEFDEGVSFFYNLFFSFNKINRDFFCSLVIHTRTLHFKRLNVTVEFVVAFFKAKGPLLNLSL